MVMECLGILCHVFHVATSQEEEEMAKRLIQDYYCSVISEPVKIYLKNKANIGLRYKKEYFVKCNQEECQYVDKNVSPCPLMMEMFR